MKQRKLIIKAFLLGIIGVLLINCTGGNKVMSVDDLLANAESMVGENVIVEGLCTHVCQTSGMKLFLQGSDAENSIRAESGANLGKFDPESIDKKVIVRGKLAEFRIDEAYLKDLEQQLMDSTHVGHGEEGAGCDTELAAEGIASGTSEMERVTILRDQIAERNANEGKEYLSQYYIEAEGYEIVK